MAIIYDPESLLKEIAPESKIKKMLKSGLSLKKAALSLISDVDFIDKAALLEVALKVVASYKKRIESLETKEKSKIKKEIKNNPRLLIQRVQNEILTQVTSEIKNKYSGEFYEWLPSKAAEPDPEHQLKYGEIYQVGVGEMPQDRWGCQCGMRILTDEEKLNL